MEIALNSDSPGGFKHGNAITSQNGLALLASITLKNALNINNNSNNNNNSKSKNKNNITKKNNNNNHLTLNHNNKNNIKHHKAPQLQHGFISSPEIASSSLSSTAAAKISSPLSTSKTATIQTLHSPEQNNVFTFTAAGLQSLTATALSTIQKEIAAVAVDQQQKQQTQNNQQLQTLTTTSTALTTVPALSSFNNNNKSHTNSLSTNHHQTNNNFSAKDPTVALLEALSIKTNKKQQNVSIPQQQTSVSSSALTAHSTVGNGGNNNSNNNANGNGNSNKNNFRIPSDILDDLASRFIINVPDMELSNLIRICFQIELAHWFYLDFFCASEEEKKLQPCGIKQFALQLFEHIPFLRQHLSSIDTILEDWKNYKLSVPTYGAILISEDLNYCLLVQSYFAKSSWGFPKGKVNENEDPVHCAAREVYEETGYDITEIIVPNDYIEAVINYQYTRLYIVRNVSLETKFSPRTRNEIKCCDWFPIDSLPVNKTDAISKPKLGINANSFFMIMPFVKRLKKWVNDKRNGVETRRKYSGGGSPTSTSPLTTSIMANGQMKSSCKKQQKRNNNPNNFNDDINALNNVGGGAAATAALSTISCGNNTNTNVNCSNSNRSKRQRHKSMGDLDGIKLNNFNNQSNCKSTINNNNNCGSTTTTSSATTTANSGGNMSFNNKNSNNNNNNNQKRHSKIVAAGSNVSNNINNNINNGCNNNNNGSSSSSKRQLFQGQSQTNNLQQNSEKIVSSFDLIRKEKQQMKAAMAKVQKQQQNLNNSNNNNGRQRAKSQSDKMCMQQQKSTGNNGHNNKQQQQRIQKQQSLIVTNTNMQNYNINNNSNQQNNINNSNKNHNNNNTIAKSNLNNNFNNKIMTTGGHKTPTPPPLSGNDLLALAAATSGVTPVAQTTRETAITTAAATPQQSFMSSICGEQKPRPLSALLHFPEVAAIKKETTDITMATADNQMPQFKRMASGTNLRILKRSTSHQHTQQNLQPPQPPQRQASALQFTPSFNSWTNFTFTKNFIANVFC